MPVEVSGAARLVEAYEVGAGVPWARGELRAGESGVELQPIEQR
jgi:hypothetical protein